MTEEQEIKIDELCEQGNDAMDNEMYKEAISYYTKALDYVPEPKEEWEATGWIHASIGDAYFQLCDFEKALEHMHIAIRIYAGEPNPFVLLRYGQCFYELKDEKQAVNYLLQAYMIEGETIFDEDEKYLLFLKSKVDL